MIIESIEIYRVRVPLAFVWKTSYGDQHNTDTVLVRMESQGHHAWGESCPPYIPNYSAEHTLATFHTVREHMAGRIIGQDIDRKSTRLNSSHRCISYDVFCLKKKTELWLRAQSNPNRYAL